MNLEILNFSKHCRGPLRTLRISLVWISNMVVSQYEEKAMSLLVFNPSLRHSMSSFHLSYVAVSGPFHSLEFYPKRASLQHCELFRNPRNCWKLFVMTDNQPVRFLTNSQTNTFTVRDSSNEQNLHIPSCYWNYIAVCLDANGVQAENDKQKFSTTLI